MTTAEVKTNGHSTKSLALYGNKDDVGAMAGRILAMLPGADKLSQSERMGLAQLALAHNLNPFNGECWALPGKGLMIGVKGLRKMAHGQIEKVGGNFFVDYREITDKEERERWGIKPGDLAFEARLYDSANLRTFTETIEKLLSAKVPWEAVEKIVGIRPYTSGVGIAFADRPDKDCKICGGSGEMKNKWGKQVNCSCWEESKMPKVQRSRKRAESNAIKQRFDVPFGVKVADEDTGEIIEGTATEIKTEPPFKDNASADAAIAEAELQGNRQAMFGDPA